MGGRPLLALSIAAFPEELDIATVRSVFDAAAAKVSEAGAILAGGHTIRDDEPKYGLAVVGTVRPDALWRKNGARPGDVAFLTKPLGTGLVLAGVRRGDPRRGRVPGRHRGDDAPQLRAAEEIRPFEPLGCHRRDRLRAPGPRARDRRTKRSPHRARLALPAGVARRAGSGRGRTCEPEGIRGTASTSPALWSSTHVSDALAALAYDPQTAGGLLFTVPGDRAAVVEASVRATRIGHVLEGAGVVLA